MHTTRLKQKLLTRFPDTQARNKGRDVMLVFKKDMSAVLDKTCEQDSDNEAVCLARAMKTVRRLMFDPPPFPGSFDKNCQENSVPHLLLSLINMVLEGPSIKDQLHQCLMPAALSVAQFLKNNSIKHMRKKVDATLSARHSSTQEISLPICIGLMLHAQTRKRDLVDKLFNLGLSISYDRVLCLPTEMGNSVC